MDIQNYFRSISKEMNALKDRIRLLIGDAHWATDGEWKESVLRTTLRRSMPNNMTVGRGFIVNGEWTSSQIDILIYDNSYPILYKDGDLVFISPAACRGVIEVKTRLSDFADTVDKLAAIGQRIRPGFITPRHIFLGIFAFEGAGTERHIELLGESSQNDMRRIIDLVSIGPSHLIKFWNQNPTENSDSYQCWHHYRLDDMAQGYFIHNILTELKPNDGTRQEQVWFPDIGKEGFLQGRLEFGGSYNREPPTVELQPVNNV